MIEDADILGSDRDSRPRRWLPAVIAAALLATALTVTATRGGHRTTPRATPVPSPSSPTPTRSGPATGPAPDVGSVRATKVVRIGAAAAVLGHTTQLPSYGTVTMLDGPPGTSPLTFSIHVGTPVTAAGGGGETGWFATENVSSVAYDSPGSLEERDVRTGALIEDWALDAVPRSIAVAAGHVWVGLTGEVFDVDPRTARTRTHPTPPGPLVDLVADPAGHHLYGAIAGDGGSRVVQWTLPELTIVRQRPLEGGHRVTHLAYGPGGLWVSSVSPTTGRGRVDRLDPGTLSRLDDAGLAPGTGIVAAYAGTGEVWLLGLHDATLRCARPRPDGVRLGRASRVPDFDPRDDPSGLVAAVGHRVYVVTAHGVIAYERSVECR